MTEIARSSRSGFTLVELIIAVGLLILLMLVVAFIFDTTGSAIGEAQAANEMIAQSANFYETIRHDVRGTERGGWLILGRRQLPDASGTPVYGSRIMKDRERELDTRCDWLMLVTSTEQFSAVDNRLVAQWNRILYGHGRRTNPADSLFSDLATQWVLVRHQLMTIWAMPFAWQELQTVQPGVHGMNERITAAYYGAGVDGGGDQAGGMRRAVRGAQSYYNRDMRWYWYGAGGGYAWNGTILTPAYDFPAYGGGTSFGRAVYEPDYWQEYTYGTYGGSARTRFQALSHCAEFQVQFALARDLRAGENGTILWRDPPAVGDSKYADPNFRAEDPLHRHALIPASGEDAGRLSFGPGDDWPVLLRITTRIFDPKERIDRDRTTVQIIPVGH